MSFNPDRVNIHELTIEEPEAQSELPFDPERDLTKKDWQAIRDNLEASRRIDNWEIFLHRAATMKLIDPSYALNIDQVAWQGMNDRLEEHKNKGNWYSFSDLAMEMKILNPNQDLNIDQTSWDFMASKLEHAKNSDWAGFSLQAMRTKIIDPNYDLNLDETAWQGMRNVLGLLREDEDWLYFSSQAMCMKILDPNYDLGISHDDWHKMKAELKKFRRGRRGRKTLDSYAAAMKIIAAEEVKVTNKGLEITMRKPKEEVSLGVSPMPEIRQF